MGIGLGLVGLGSFGSAFAELFKSHPRVDRVALCDREAERIERFATRPSFRDKFREADAYGSLDAICEADLDALVIITQPWLHAPQAVQAMEAGKHVYSAVPVMMVPDGDEILAWCDRIVETCRRTGLRYMLGETTFYRPEAMYCRRRAAEGAFGRFVYAEGEYFHDRDLPSCNLRDVRRSRLASAAGREWLEAERGYRERGIEPDAPMHYPTHSTSGPIATMQAHAVKACAWATRRPADDDVAPGAIGNETALFAMSNGAAMRICEHREIGHTGQETFRVFGTAAFRAAIGEGYLGGHGGSHAYLVHEFCEAIAADRQPAINAWEAVRYMAPGVVAHQSALRDGEVLDVPDWGDAPE